ncbi:MAG: DUF411 domain-containing protein [Bradyrhizobium sp.]
MRRRNFLAMLGVLGAASLARAQGARDAVLYKNPQCGCCEDYAAYLRRSGFRVNVVATHDLDAIKSQHHVPEKLNGCHTTLVDGYVVEGHVPVSILERLLRERPPIRGISLPGMPQGSPGMTGIKKEPFQIYEIGARAKGNPRVYAVE